MLHGQSVVAKIFSTRNKPALKMTSEQKARMNVAPSSSGVALSSNQNDGKVKHKVMTAETTNGKIRSPKRKLAEATTDFGYLSAILRQANTTSKDSGQ
jgi:hypothetical protein